jgi:Holliday junction resolvasome RuvABC endonuclease subunit
MILLGIDGGFAITGWCIASIGEQYPDKLKGQIMPGFYIRQMGIIETQKSARKVPAAVDNVSRARKIADGIQGLVFKGGAEGPVSLAVDCICAEAMSHVPAAQAAAKLAMAWGVYATVAHLASLPIAQASPQDIKMAVAGTRKASKALMERRLLEDYPECSALLEGIPASKREHPLDALGAIVACLDTDIVRAGMRR